MNETKTIRVTFSVDIDMKTLNALKNRLEELGPGTVEYSSVYDQINETYKHFISRLDGECAAYMNIAKNEAKETFGL